MVKLIHCADLHLSEREVDYGLKVLDEIVEVVREEDARFLLIAGDLFDTFKDTEVLRGRVREVLAGLENCEVLFVPGNHEELRRGRGDLDAFDWGEIRFLNERPFALERRAVEGLEIEFLGVAHRESYDDYRDWPVPARAADVRVALAHGLLAGQVYAGPEEEQGGAAIDPDLFVRYECDYAALGHIHRGRVMRIKDTICAYPGSARVWRSGETGEHGVYVIELDGGPARTPRFRPLQSAGVFRRLELPLGLEGALVSGAAEMGRDWGPNDWVEIVLSGIVEDEKQVALLEQELNMTWAGRLRRLDFERRLEILPDIAAHPVARKFLEAWDARQADIAEDARRRLMSRAREMALQEIKNALG